MPPAVKALCSLLLICCVSFFLPSNHAAELRGARLFKSGPIQITADGVWVWSVNPDNDSVTRLNTLSEEVREIRIPGEEKHAPKGISLTEDGSEIWVACHDSDRLVVFD
jgi:hypothetical protein